MNIGQKIKSVRHFRGITQKELGLRLGFSEKNADVRIAQYESGTRVPKKDLKENISNVLNLNPKSLGEHSVDTIEDMMFTLFDIDDIYGLSKFSIDGMPCIKFNEEISKYLLQWKDMKDKLENNTITQEEYIDWKYNFKVK